MTRYIDPTIYYDTDSNPLNPGWVLHYSTGDKVGQRHLNRGPGRS